MPVISYILPAYNEEACIGDAIESIATQNSEKEIIVVDGGSSDNTRKVARQYGACRLIASDLGRGKQMNRGAERACGEILCFLHADTRLPPQAAESIRRILETPSTIAGSFRLAFDRRSGLLDFYARCSRINHALFTYGDQGLFLRKPTFEELGGFKDYPFLEDVDIQRRLRRLGSFVKSSLAVTTSARRFAQQGALKQQMINMAIISAFLCGASPFALRKLYPNNR